MTKPNRKRVVVTAMGAITPVGNSVEESWANIRKGKVNADYVTLFDASQFPCRIGYEIKGFDPKKYGMSEKDSERLNRAGQFGAAATLEAFKNSGLTRGNYDPSRTMVSYGVGMGSPDLKWYEEVYLKENYQHESIKRHLRFFPNMLTQYASQMVNAQGGALTVHTACASSGQAVGEAFNLIARGDADLVFTGGADSMINPFYMAGFCLLGALTSNDNPPEKACKPFDKDRSGFVLGEGACVLLFEEYEHAKKRGAKIIAEISGYGVTESAYRITDLHPEGQGPIEAMQMAIQDAGISPSQIGYVNAHGTSTQLNDRVEALSVAKVFGDHPVIVSSTKSTTGHLISAAGAMELAVCILSLRDSVLPPSVNLTEKDPDCAVVLAPAQESKFDAEYALSNSVGFGGSNTAVIAKRFK